MSVSENPEQTYPGIDVLRGRTSDASIDRDIRATEAERIEGERAYQRFAEVAQQYVDRAPREYKNCAYFAPAGDAYFANETGETANVWNLAAHGAVLWDREGNHTHYVESDGMLLITLQLESNEASTRPARVEDVDAFEARLSDMELADTRARLAA